MAKGYLALVLHAHLPYVRHPEHEEFLEEDWLFEAITETYIPLLDIYRSLVDDGVKFQITMSLTPPLMNMLANELLQYRYVRHIEKLIRLAEMECDRTKHEWHFKRTAEMYLNKFRRARDIFVNRYHCNLNNGFREFLERGVLDVITCGGTHGFFPLMMDHPKAIDAQLKAAVATHEKHLGQKPQGIWLAECGFFPGLEKHLHENGIKYFFVDSHGVLYADKRPKFGVYAPVFCSRQHPVAAFGRDIESSKSVWSAEEGYPGDARYREFYRDIGFDLPLDYIGPFIHDGGLRTNTGIKYHKITGRNVDKQPYDHEEAMSVAAEHAGNFMFNREKQVEHLAEFFDRPPMIVSPYDAELFGHWWYEGPDFINFLIRKTAFDQNTVEMITPREYLKRHPVNQVTMPSFSSWGHKGYSEVWLEGSNDWIYRHLHKAAERMTELADTYYSESGVYEEALDQAARELLLAQSSDWAFIMKMGTTVEYAVRRTKLHLNRFTDLYYAIKNRDLNTEWLKQVQHRDDIFSEIDFRIYANRR
ncbi:MAG: 1,4-alpha-glucan branching protein domain-containing protein [Spirochaetota bacterium]